MTLLALVAIIFFGFATYNLTCAFVDIPTKKTSRMMMLARKQQGVKAEKLLDVYITKIAGLIAPYLKLDKLKRNKLQRALDIAGLELTPEIYTARAWVTAGAVGLCSTCTLPIQFTGRPVSEVAYSRSDYDGYQWWTTWYDGAGGKAAPKLAKEIDGFQNALFKLPAFKTLDTMRRFCRYTQATSEATEFNLYSETDHLYIWIRMVTRSRDYNVYVHYYEKAAVGGKG